MKAKDITIFGKSCPPIGSLILDFPASKCQYAPVPEKLISLKDINLFLPDTEAQSDGNFSPSNASALESHPLPRYQVPLLPHLQIMLPDHPSWGDLMQFFTAFQHSRDQKCAVWAAATDCDEYETCIWYKSEVTRYSSQEAASSMGPFSNIATMNIVYTCIFNKCSIGCPCALCVRCQEFKCRKICRDTPCADCYPQCKLHAILSERRFDKSKHQVTVITVGEHSVNYIVKHAGIPDDCEPCTADLLDHQKFHILPHLLCKFCLQLQRPSLNYLKPILSVEDYMKAKTNHQFQLDHTCAFCMKCFDKVCQRKEHERTQHEQTGRQYACNDCEKTYTNSNALKYHWEQKHNSASKVHCESCGQSFSSKTSLQEHIEVQHNNASRFTCDECSATFGVKRSMLRHKKYKHNRDKTNWSLIQSRIDLDFKCTACVKVFKRADGLKRHVKLVHEAESEPEFDCSHCQKSFKLKSNCKKHEQICHLK